MSQSKIKDRIAEMVTAAQGDKRIPERNKTQGKLFSRVALIAMY